MVFKTIIEAGTALIALVIFGKILIALGEATKTDTTLSIIALIILGIGVVASVFKGR